MSSPDSAKKIWSILDLLTWGTTYLTEKQFDDARLTIELMLAHVLKKKRIQLYTQFDQPLSDIELAHFKELLKRRLTHEPLQYILGYTEFMGFRFAVDRRVLIPRPETELLVEQAVTMLKETFPESETLSVLDIGTGSGCIGISIAALLTSASVTAIDISDDALLVAKDNAISNNVIGRLHIIKKDILQIDSADTAHYHAILSNPPYISTKEFAQLSKEVKDFEPSDALADGGDGLKYFRSIAQFAKDSLIENGIVGVEHAFDQSEEVQRIFSDAGFSEPIVIKDYQGIQRHLFYKNTGMHTS